MEGKVRGVGGAHCFHRHSSNSITRHIPRKPPQLPRGTITLAPNSEPSRGSSSRLVHRRPLCEQADDIRVVLPVIADRRADDVIR